MMMNDGGDNDDDFGSLAMSIKVLNMYYTIRSTRYASSGCVEIIKRKRSSQTQKTSSDLEDLQTLEEAEGPKLHKHTKNFKGNRNARILPVSAKDFRMTIQQNYQYQAMAQRP
ncbi:hypothetical protein MTR_6g452960 [Medicago truncatula]|uniref:Uncharacterized protein n=1 Tax=Medicago truncatula TaxID=3880 RepID=A0A072UKH7_MEDTR|nr:hypothetical protein MTR_6g452960 [Medicago truncatula]